MIKSIKVKSSQTLLLLICFALLFFITACGGSKDENTGGTSTGSSISLSSTVTSLAAGESSIITATVTDGLGAPVQGKTVTFTLLHNNSGATITALNGGHTDAQGQAIATYTAGANSPTTSVQDMIQASASGATAAATITRISSSTAATGFRMSLTADSTSLSAGQSTIVKATVTDGLGSPASGQALTFTLLENNSGATLTTLSLGVTDASGQAQAIYKAGANSPTSSVQDTIQASVTGTTGVVIITRLSSSAALTGFRMSLMADSTSLSAGNSTIIRATVTDGSGAPSVGQTVTFALLTNMSGATLVPLNGGATDACGQAIATYTAGANSPNASVQDTIQASVTGTTGAVIITRTSGSGTSTGLRLALTAEATSLAAGESIIITATVTDGTGSAVQGQSVAFSFVANSSHADLVILSGTTDVTGGATALYTAGSFTAAQVQDIVQASITGSTKAIIITKTGTSSGGTAASLDLLASPPTVKSDGTTSSTITVTAKNSSNAALSGIEITMGADTGNLSAATVTTGTNGTATLTFSAGGGTIGPFNRTAIITATTGSVSSQVPIEVIGSTVTMSASGTTLTNAGTDSITLTVTAKNAGGYGVNGAAVALTQTGTGIVNIASPTGTANSSGVFTTTVTGATAGTVTIIARALGASFSIDLTINTAALTFAIDQQTLCNPGCAIVAGNPNPTAMEIGNTLQIRVNVPTPGSSVTFATTLGTWVGGTSTIQVISGATSATATLQTTSAGIANVQVYLTGTPTIQDTLTVAMASGAAAYSIILQATPTVVSMNTGYSTITATVRDSLGFVVANAPVSFSMLNPTGGGETISPPMKLTASNGEASTKFTAGTLPTYDAGGVKIHAAVVGTAVATGTSPSGSDAAVVIGGVPGSIAFGMATELSVNTNKTQYIQAMSVLVADINGNPVSGAVVSLSVWPIAWSTGLGCTYDADGTRVFAGPPVVTIPGNFGTFLNEDRNENLILDSSPAPDEDGYRRYYADPTTVLPDGTKDGFITPTNSAGGTVPLPVKTGTDGVATFDLTYPKNSAIWTLVRVRATTLVQGSETVGQIIFRLNALEGDVNPCRLGDSPYTY